MNTHTMIGAALVLALLSGACSKQSAPTDDAAQTPAPTVDPAPAPTDDSVPLAPTQDDSAERTAAAQNRIADAFYSTIVPNLESCWGQVGGKGGVQFKYTYARDGDNWVLQQIEADGAALDKGQDAIAMKCMQDAARGSTFALEPEEVARNAKEMEIYWGWPVPLPEDTTQLARMIIENPPAPECRKLCHDCAWKPGQSFCAMACSGWSGCREDGTGSGCQMTRPQCRTGWSGSLAGIVMARATGEVRVARREPDVARSSGP